jgi:CheY-like chemotaxis protein
MTEPQVFGKLALVIDSEPGARAAIRELLESRGHDVVHASNGLAGLELLQRLPTSFSLVLVDLEVNGFPGLAVVETLRIFRPELPVLCMSRRVTAVPNGCLRKPIDHEALDALLNPAAAAGVDWALSVDEETVMEAQTRYGSGGDLVEAALQLSKKLPNQD